MQKPTHADTPGTNLGEQSDGEDENQNWDGREKKILQEYAYTQPSKTFTHLAFPDVRTLRERARIDAPP